MWVGFTHVGLPSLPQIEGEVVEDVLGKLVLKLGVEPQHFNQTRNMQALEVTVRQSSANKNANLLLKIVASIFVNSATDFCRIFLQRSRADFVKTKIKEVQTLDHQMNASFICSPGK